MIKNYSTALFFGVLLTLIQYFLKSEFLWKYLLSNLLNIQVAVLAINGATLGIVLTRLRELSDHDPKYQFKDVLDEVLFSFKEMIGLVVMTIFIGIMAGSEVIPVGFFKTNILACILFATFCYTIYILFDFLKGVCVLLGFK